jgi:glutathione synthase/RimK-type ligase-like ATP-grasp enzyme
LEREISRVSILFIQGINDNGIGHLNVNKKGKHKIDLDGSCNVLAMINFQGVSVDNFMIYGKNAQQPPVSLAERPSLIFNEISDPDSHATALKRCNQLCDQTTVPVVNPPDKIQRTSRDQVFELLKGIPTVTMPKTVRFQAEAPEDVFMTAEAIGMDLPLIVRIAGDHGGKSMVLLRELADIEKLHIFPFGETWFYLTEYVDYQDTDGIYHKQRIVMVDGEPIARHAIFDSRWNVHASSRVAENDASRHGSELERVQELRDKLIPKARGALDEIARRMELDYFGIDCYINPDGKLLVFEANANMNMLYNKVPEIEPQIALIKDKLCTMLTARSGEQISWSSDAET